MTARSAKISPNLCPCMVDKDLLLLCMTRARIFPEAGVSRFTKTIMRFSRRTSWNIEENALSCAYRERVALGLPIADLTASNPTRCGFQYDPALLSALTDERALEYDPQPRGLLAAREAVCRYYADHRVQIEPDQIVLTTSTSEAYSFLFRLLCDPGNEVLVPQPSYPLFDFLADLDDVRIKPAPLVYDHGWQIDAEGFRRAITPETRAVVLVHPNNPTGHFLKPWEVEELGRLCLEHGLSLIVDEVFLDYKFEGHGASFAKGVGEVPVYVVSGLSKVAGLPQMKAAWIVATGPKRAEAMDRLDVIADTFLSMNAPVQWALSHWLGERRAIQDQIRARVVANLAELDRQLSEQTLINRLEAEGGWYSVLRIPALERDELTVRELLERGVWVHPGYFFGMGESGWLVISLLGQEADFAAGVTTLVAYLGTHLGSNKSANRPQE